jgi:hypothetical protein
MIVSANLQHNINSIIQTRVEDVGSSVKPEDERVVSKVTESAECFEIVM